MIILNVLEDYISAFTSKGLYTFMINTPSALKFIHLIMKRNYLKNVPLLFFIMKNILLKDFKH